MSLKMMNLGTDYRTLATQIGQTLPLPKVSCLYFPRLQPDGFRDEFGFVLLDSGDVGPFYVSLDDTLPLLWQRYPAPENVQLPLDALLDKLNGHDLAERALGFGTFNALSQYVMRLAGYQPGKRQHKSGSDSDSAQTIGMVGYFCPLVERLVAQGKNVIVLENQPARVTAHPQVQVVTSPDGLANCAEILCTASTLINDTLDQILAASAAATRFSLIGPTSGGLPDVLFARGVDTVGGIHFPDQKRLLQVLAAEQSWGSAGDKYEISRTDYPGLAALLIAAQTAHS